MTEQKIIEIRQTVEELYTISKDVNCEICGKVFKNSGAKRMHCIKTHLIIKKASDLTLKSNKTLANQEKKSEANQETRFYCPDKNCDKFFKARKLLIQHIRKTHEEKKFECNFCLTKFGLERDLKYHMVKTCPIGKNLQINQEPSSSIDKLSQKKNESNSKKMTSNKKKFIENSTQTENTNQYKKLVLIPVIFTPISSKRNVIIQTGDVSNSNETFPCQPSTSIVQRTWETTNTVQNSYPSNVAYEQNNCLEQNYEMYNSVNYQSNGNFDFTQHQQAVMQETPQYEFVSSCSNQTYINPNPIMSNWKHNETQTLPTYETETSQQDYWTIEDSTSNAVATQTAQTSWSRSQDFGTQFSWEDFNAEPVPINQQYVVQATQTLPLEEIDQIDWFSTNEIPSVRETNEIGSMTDDLYEIHQLRSP